MPLYIARRTETHGTHRLAVSSERQDVLVQDRSDQRSECDWLPGLDSLRRMTETFRGGAIKLGPASNFGGKFSDVEIELVSLDGDDLILCQVTTRARSDESSIALDAADFERGQLARPSYIRPQRLFTVEQRVILYSVGKVKTSKLVEVLAKARALFA